MKEKTKTQKGFITILLLAIALIALVSIGSVFIAPKVQDYIKVNKLLNEAKKFEVGGNYQNALASLVAAGEKWSLQDKQNEIAELQARQEQFVKDQEALTLAIEKIENNELYAARELLQNIGNGFPKQELIKNKLSEIQVAIEENLKQEAMRQEKARKQAEQMAQAEAAAARIAREAEYRRQQEEQARLAELQRQQQARDSLIKIEVCKIGAQANINNFLEAGKLAINEGSQKCVQDRLSIIQQQIGGGAISPGVVSSMYSLARSSCQIIVNDALNKLQTQSEEVYNRQYLECLNK